MISYDYVIEDGGDGSAHVVYFSNKAAYDLFMDLVDEQYILDDGVLRVIGEISPDQLWDEEKVQMYRGDY